MKRIWLKEDPSDAPGPQQFVVVRKGGEVLTGTIADIAEDLFNAAHYGEPHYEVAEVWSWTDAGPVKMTVVVGPKGDIPVGADLLTLDIVDPSGAIVASTK